MTSNDKKTPRILITVNDQGGAIIRWNYNELADCLRANTKHHEPIVVVSYTDKPPQQKELDGKSNVPRH